MARPVRQTVDYFPHYCKHGRSMFTIESSFGNDGYAGWFKILEELGAAEGHYYDCRDTDALEYLIARIKMDEATFEAFMAKLAKLGSIDKELWQQHRVIWSDHFVQGLKDLYAKRVMPLPSKPRFSGPVTPNTGISGPETPISGGDNPQRIGEKRKEEQSIGEHFSVDKSGGRTPQQIYDDPNMDRFEKAKLLAVPDCPKCKGSGIIIYEPEAGSGLPTIKTNCGCWYKNDKYK